MTSDWIPGEEENVWLNCDWIKYLCHLRLLQGGVIINYLELPTLADSKLPRVAYLERELMCNFSHWIPGKEENGRLNCDWIKYLGDLRLLQGGADDKLRTILQKNRKQFRVVILAIIYRQFRVFLHENKSCWLTLGACNKYMQPIKIVLTLLMNTNNLRFYRELLKNYPKMSIEYHLYLVNSGHKFKLTQN